MQTEFLFRMCELCLAFDVSDRAVARDLERWTRIAFDKNWWREEVCAAEASYAKLVSSGNVLSIVGVAIARAAFPEVWAPALTNVVANPPHVVTAAGTQEDRATPMARTIPVLKDTAHVDLERGGANLQSGEDEQNGNARCVSFRCKVFGIISLVVLGAAGLLGASIGIIRASEHNWQEEYPTEPQDSAPSAPEHLSPGATTMVSPSIVSWDGNGVYGVIKERIPMVPIGFPLNPVISSHLSLVFVKSAWLHTKNYIIDNDIGKHYVTLLNGHMSAVARGIIL